MRADSSGQPHIALADDAVIAEARLLCLRDPQQALRSKRIRIAVESCAINRSQQEKLIAGSTTKH